MDIHFLASVPYFLFNLQLTVIWLLVATFSQKLCSNIPTINLVDSFHSLFSLTSLQHLSMSTTFPIFHISDPFFSGCIAVYSFSVYSLHADHSKKALITGNCSLYVMREHPNLPSYLWWQTYNLSTGKKHL